MHKNQSISQLTRAVYGVTFELVFLTLYPCILRPTEVAVVRLAYTWTGEEKKVKLSKLI